MISYRLTIYQLVIDRVRRGFIAISDSYSQMRGSLWLLLTHRELFSTHSDGLKEMAWLLRASRMAHLRSINGRRLLTLSLDRPRFEAVRWASLLSGTWQSRNFGFESNTEWCISRFAGACTSSCIAAAYPTEGESDLLGREFYRGGREKAVWRQLLSAVTVNAT